MCISETIVESKEIEYLSLKSGVVQYTLTKQACVICVLSFKRKNITTKRNNVPLFYNIDIKESSILS